MKYAWCAPCYSMPLNAACYITCHLLLTIPPESAEVTSKRKQTATYIINTAIALSGHVQRLCTFFMSSDAVCMCKCVFYKGQVRDDQPRRPLPHLPSEAVSLHSKGRTVIIMKLIEEQSLSPPPPPPNSLQSPKTAVKGFDAIYATMK